MNRNRAFTLIELLVVVGIIAVLISILLPSLSKARANARAIKCGAQMRSISAAVGTYLTDSSGAYPPSYVYTDANGQWSLHNQIHPPTNGYMHWSYFLFNNIKDLRAFTCPEFEMGGVPRTNPGPDGSKWMPGQVDQNGSSGNGTLEDRQAPFVAFTANAAIMPRNKFDDAARDSDPSTAGGQRLNTFVRQNNIRGQSRTILATEFNSNWRTIAVNQGGGYKAVGHRPITPFISLGSSSEFANPPSAFFVYPGSLYDKPTLDSLSTNNTSLISDSVQLNAVGRNHPGNTSNFLYVDGHVERKTIFDTLKLREWGDAFYTLTGDQTVR
jgi:prepilin-type N-terminal cleavage/methylation domain-containing protein/prepilin-type processing-associated H-X9-DG protein